MPTRALLASVLLIGLGQSAPLAAQPVPAAVQARCVYRAMPVAERIALGRAFLAKKTDEMTSMAMPYIDSCSKQYRWPVDRALSAVGAAAAHSLMDVLAIDLGSPSLSAEVFSVLENLPTDRLAQFDNDAADEASSRWIIQQLFSARPEIKTLIEGQPEAWRLRFQRLLVLSVKTELIYRQF